MKAGEPRVGDFDASLIAASQRSRFCSGNARLSVVLLGTLSVACLLVAANDANAQAAGAAVTPPAGTKRVSADFRSNVAYASNISGGDDTLAAIRGIEPSDITYGAGATLKFQLPSGRNVAFLTAAADARRHDRNKILDGEDYQVSAGVGTRVGPCSGLLGASYARRRSLTEDLALPVATNITEQPLGSAALNCGGGAFISAVQASVGKLQNKTKRSGFVDSETKGASVSAGYRNATLGDISLIGQYSRVVYANPPTNMPVPILPGSQDFEQYRIGLQYARKIGMRLSGTASVLSTKLNTSGVKSSGVSANAALSYKATSRIQLSLGYDRSDQASVLVNTSYLHAQSVDFDINYRLSQRISLSAGVRGSQDKYRGGVPTPLQIRDSKQLAENVSGSLTIGRNIQVILSAAHVDRKADVRIYDFKSDSVTLGLTTQF